MGTRGSVAWLKPNGDWRGVYNHWDSYPTGLGIDVMTQVKDIGMEKLISSLKMVGDWRELESKGICEYCGNKVGQPHSINGLAFAPVSSMVEAQKNGDTRYDEVLRNIKDTGYSDPDAKNHQHGRGAKDQYDPRKDPLFMEWVYLLDLKNQAIEVWNFSCVPKDWPGAVELEHSKGCYYGHFKVGTVYTHQLKSKKAIEKLAESLEKMGAAEHEKLYEKAKADQKKRGVAS